MANKKISELPAAGAITGPELVEIVKGGVNSQTTAQTIANLAAGGVTSVNAQTGAVVLDAGDVGADAAGAAAAAQAASQPVDADLTAIAGISPANDDIIQRKAGSWVSRTLAQYRTDLALVTQVITNGVTASAPSENAVFDALALKQDILVTFRRLSASHTLDATDLSNVNTGLKVIIEMNVGSANNLTVPLNATQAFPIGSVLEVSQYGGGQTSFVATGGVTIRASAGVLTIGSQYSTARLIKVDTDEWYLNNGDPTVLSGTWTPTLTNTTNIAASTAYLCSYSRIGNRVNFSGRVDVDPTSTGSTVLGMSLPVLSAFTQAYQAGGTAFSPGVAGHGAAILADATNDRLTLQFVTVDVANQAFYFSGGYEVI